MPRVQDSRGALHSWVGRSFSAHSLEANGRWGQDQPLVARLHSQMSEALKTSWLASVSICLLFWSALGQAAVGTWRPCSLRVAWRAGFLARWPPAWAAAWFLKCLWHKNGAWVSRTNTEAGRKPWNREGGGVPSGEQWQGWGLLYTRLLSRVTLGGWLPSGLVFHGAGRSMARRKSPTAVGTEEATSAGGLAVFLPSPTLRGRLAWGWAQSAPEGVDPRRSLPSPSEQTGLAMSAECQGDWARWERGESPQGKKF